METSAFASRSGLGIYRRRKTDDVATSSQRVYAPYPHICAAAIVQHSADIATASQTHNIYLTLLTILFAYAYDSRTTQKDPTPESAWTICSLTPAFAALDPAPYTTPSSSPNAFDPVELATTFAVSYRRALAYPLHRSFILAERCRTDVASFLAGGKRLVVRCLHELKDILDHHDVYYVYSKVWVDDLCLWAQAYAR